MADTSQFAANRIAKTQPTYDFLTGTTIPPPAQPLQQSFRQSQARTVSAGLLGLSDIYYVH